MLRERSSASVGTVWSSRISLCVLEHFIYTCLLCCTALHWSVLLPCSLTSGSTGHIWRPTLWFTSTLNRPISRWEEHKHFNASVCGPYRRSFSRTGWKTCCSLLRKQQAVPRITGTRYSYVFGCTVCCFRIRADRHQPHWTCTVSLVVLWLNTSSTAEVALPSLRMPASCRNLLTCPHVALTFTCVRPRASARPLVLGVARLDSNAELQTGYSASS